MDNTIKIVCAGDFSPRELLAQAIEDNNYNMLFDEVRPVISGADYSIVNLEAPIVTNSSAKPIDKIGPNLRCSAKSVDALVYAGFDMVALANNHFYDFGDTGVKDTLNACTNRLDVIGGGLDISSASKAIRKTINNKSFTFINCCEHEFSIATKHTGGSNPLNPFDVYRQIQEAKKTNDYIVIIVHGGREHFPYPTIRMKDIYRFFIDAGANVVINHHQHCFCGYEKYNEGLIFYGLGNFCFYNKRFSHKMWNYGFFVELLFDGSNVSFNLYPYEQCSDKMGVFLLKDKDLDSFNKRIKELSETISNDEALESRLEEFVKKSDKNPLVIFEPYSNKILSAMRRRNILPSFLSHNKLKQIRAKLLCESHRDCILKALK